ncbi:hypothetical protein P154DRAFT_434731 [Amniculicola lignicola CBS 123094]|uniref:DUF7924 domain-containing protein n=1 Tax=Amniculicola lignicola CBS 123094 TaxID=1392246 RepID=A0A6A5WGE2_9PLEO|nr:hypothetical protein P154DRAFT_434731 [Amniculicola lignicola CBS 123094]
MFIHHSDIPETLRKHIDDVIMDMRKPTTPSAARLARISRRTRGMNEPQGKEMLARDLLFKTEIDDGEELIQVLPEVMLGHHWLPAAPDRWVERQYGALEQPRPDHAVGYITQQDALSMNPRSKAALERTEEDKITRHALTTQLHFPFLTCQWKSQKSGEGHYHASLQGARDGAAIVRSLHDFYRTAQHTPPIVDTAHFSLTTDTDSVKLWVHWVETKEDGGADYHMELISQAFLRPLTPRDTGMVDMRKMLRNILEYAVGARLDNIKAAIASLPLPPLRTRSPKRGPSKKSMSSSDTMSNSATPVGHPLYHEQASGYFTIERKSIMCKKNINQTLRTSYQ